MAVSDTSPRTAARIAGFGYAAVFVLALFANFAVRMRLVVPDDAATTVQNIVASEGMFRLGLAAFLAIFVLDVAIAWALYVLFRPAGRQRSLLAAWFRLTYTVFLGAALVFMWAALQLATNPTYLDAYEPGSRSAGVLLALDAFDYTWLVGLAAFGFHLILVGRLILTSRMAPRLLGVVLAVAGAAYVVDTLARTLLASYADYADLFLAMVAVPSVLGELAFTIWLLTRAGRTTPVQPQRPVAAPA